MRGDWIGYLLRESASRAIRPAEAIRFAGARARRKPIAFSLGGVRFENADHVLWGIVADVFLRKVYSPPGMEIREEDVVVDIGAHRGVFAAYAARRTRGIILAFEPDPANCSQLRELLRINKIDTVQCHQCAVGARTGRAPLWLADSGSRNTLTGYDYATHQQLQTSIEVDVMSLDDALAGLDRVDLLKMDCEGAEVDILMACRDYTLAKIRRMALETHEPGASPAMVSLLERLQSLYSRVVLRQLPGKQMGYLFTWQQAPLRLEAPMSGAPSKTQKCDG